MYRRILVFSLLALACQGADPTEDPGRVTLHRLNRSEYNNTVRDLLDSPLRPADDFPFDDIGNGFDNQADVLSLSPTQIELYQRAAEALVAEALRDPTRQDSTLLAGAFPMKAGSYARGSFLLLASNIDVGVVQRFPSAGMYRFTVRAYGEQAGADPPRMVLRVGGKDLKTFDVTATVAAPALYQVTAQIDAGEREVAVAFINDFYDMPNKLDRNLAFESVRIETSGAVVPNPARSKILLCDPRTRGEVPCATDIITAFAGRAFRRPLQPDEVAALLRLYEGARAQGLGFEDGVALMLQGALISPHFLFRVELDPDPTSPLPHRLSDHELATRLSYFLHGSMPDDALRAAAAAGALGSDEGLAAQIDRLLDDPRADALNDGFAAQWLYQRALLDQQPSYASFPTWSEPLRAALLTETRLFLNELLRGGAPFDQLLTADFSYLNDALARHYGLPTTGLGADFKRVSLAGSPRRGVLTQGSVLTVTSYPTRTSPVRRGKWVLEQLLCSAPPPPPPGVEGLIEQPMPQGTLRQRLEEHRKNPVCASCHATMDPIGFGLENFNGVGAFRTKDGPGPVDASGQLPGGAAFNGAAELSALLTADPRLPRCVAEKLFTYALGRAPLTTEADHLDRLGQDFAAGGFRFRDLVRAILMSERFRSRRGEPQGDAP